MTKISDIDVVFISYKEDNCEENWSDLLTKFPHAQRVHGVEGSDAAHKEAARLASTERVITIDGDCIVDPEFFDLEIDFDHPKIKGCVLSWSAKNNINGLVYGNGGIKCWPVDFIENMKTHELSDDPNPASQIEFCWDKKYIQMNNVYSETFPNGSPIQAFRAGFREGVKLSLDQGHRVKASHLSKDIWYGNLKRLLIWMNVGSDVEYGLWAILGTRLGCYMTACDLGWDYITVRDFDAVDKIFEDTFLEIDDGTPTNQKCYKTGYAWSRQKLIDKIDEVGIMLASATGLPVELLNETASIFFKQVYVGVPRSGTMVTEKEMLELMKKNGVIDEKTSFS
jgi:hypothetical protein